MRRKLWILCITVFLIVSCLQPVSAQEFDPAKTGTVSVTLTQPQSQAPLVGAQLQVYFVATVGMDAGGNLHYAYTDSFQNSEIDLNDPALAVKLDAFVSEHNISSFSITTDESGTATCTELTLGLYLIRQAVAVEGFSPCTPFLVTLPGTDADGYVYEVNASPKTEVAKLTSITIKKVWNTNASAQAADHVTVQLLQNGNVIQTATLNAQNNWQITYPDMPQSDAYSVQEIHVPKGFTATYSQAGYTFTVTNTSTLIQTGQLLWPIPVLSVSGILFLAVGIVLLRKKGKTHG